MQDRNENPGAGNSGVSVSSTQGSQGDKLLIPPSGPPSMDWAHKYTDDVHPWPDWGGADWERAMCELRNSEDTLKWAQFFTSMGLYVHPLRPRSKVPLLSKWQERGPATDDELKAWFGRGSANIGLVCGGASSLLVVDWDDVGAWHTWRERALALGIRSTFTVAGRRGVHSYYQCEYHPPHKLKLVNEAGAIVGDVLTTGAQVATVPSMHPEGIRYRVLDESPLQLVEHYQYLNLPLQRSPEREPVQTQPQPAQPQPAYTERQSSALVELVRGAPEGNRNSLLYWCSNRLYDLGFREPEVVYLLLKPALEVGLTEREALATIRSAAKQERQAPRPAPDPRARERRAFGRLLTNSLNSNLNRRLGR